MNGGESGSNDVGMKSRRCNTNENFRNRRQLNSSLDENDSSVPLMKASHVSVCSIRGFFCRSAGLVFQLTNLTNTAQCRRARRDRNGAKDQIRQVLGGHCGKAERILCLGPRSHRL